MAIKLDRYHSDYLLWIYPLIILGLIFFAIKRDNANRESGKSSSAGVNAVSPITIGEKDRAVNNSKMTYYSDSTQIFNAYSKDDY